MVQYALLQAQVLELEVERCRVGAGVLGDLRAHDPAGRLRGAGRDGRRGATSRSSTTAARRGRCTRRRTRHRVSSGSASPSAFARSTRRRGKNGRMKARRAPALPRPEAPATSAGRRGSALGVFALIVCAGPLLFGAVDRLPQIACSCSAHRRRARCSRRPSCRSAGGAIASLIAVRRAARWSRNSRPPNGLARPLWRTAADPRVCARAALHASSRAGPRARCAARRGGRRGLVPVGAAARGGPGRTARCSRGVFSPRRPSSRRSSFATRDPDRASHLRAALTRRAGAASDPSQIATTPAISSPWGASSAAAA